jgi:glutamate/tyrosine decarboxylase-like PLP-dependent enzyme
MSEPNRQDKAPPPSDTLEALERQAAASGFVKKPLAMKKGGAALGAWFLGPKGENGELFKRLVEQIVSAHLMDRERDSERDPAWITSDRKSTDAYKEAVELLEEQLAVLLEDLGKSVPFFSYRYQGHMLWDVTMPSVLGYLAALLYNQNNVAAEASPVTTQLEMAVGDDLCEMLGYYVPTREFEEDEGRKEWRPAADKVAAWGHITCDGSVANSEAVWCARNLKYYPLGIAAALSRVPALEPAIGLDVGLPNGSRRALVELSEWELLNLEADEVLALPRRLSDEYDLTDVDVDGTLVRYTVQELGLSAFRRRFAPRSHDPVILAPATAHYSWPKAAAMMGLGRSALQAVPVDLNGRMDLGHLRRTLDRCLRDRRPVVMVVAVMGSTQESAVDPLAGILELRERYRAKGLEFWLHADAAWGGYFASMLRPGSGFVKMIPAKQLADADDEEARELMDLAGWPDEKERFFRPTIAMNEYVHAQFEVLGQTDSITVDPHKAGYIPYPAGGLCYRNSAMRHLVAFTAPVVYKGKTDPTVGLYGIEGSKPGAAAAATYLSHRVIRTNQDGYGRILSRCMWGSKRFYATLVTMAQEDDPFVVVPFQRLPVERSEKRWTRRDLKAELDRIREDLVHQTDSQLMTYLGQEGQEGKERRRWFRNLGSDQIIVSYSFNFKRDGKLNARVDLANRLNKALFERLSRLRPTNDPFPGLFVTSSAFDPATYGRETVGLYKRRLGLDDDGKTPVDFLISTNMDPWLTDTETGNIIPTLIGELREVVLAEVQSLLGELDQQEVDQRS